MVISCETIWQPKMYPSAVEYVVAMVDLILVMTMNLAFFLLQHLINPRYANAPLYLLLGKT